MARNKNYRAYDRFHAQVEFAAVNQKLPAQSDFTEAGLGEAVWKKGEGIPIIQ